MSVFGVCKMLPVQRHQAVEKRSAASRISNDENRLLDLYILIPAVKNFINHAETKRKKLMQEKKKDEQHTHRPHPQVKLPVGFADDFYENAIADVIERSTEIFHTIGCK